MLNNEGRKKVTVSTAWNEEANIGRQLRSILSQKIPNFFNIGEVIVVAGGTDRTIDIVKKFELMNPRIKLIEQRKKNIASQFNKILELSMGEIIVILNADTLLLPNGLSKLLKPMLNPKVGAVVGKALPTNSPSKCWGFFAHKVYSLMYSNEFLRVDFEGGATLRKKLLEKIPETLFDYESFTDFAIRKKKYKIIAVREPVSLTKSPDNPQDFVNQRRRWIYTTFQAKKYGIHAPHLSWKHAFLFLIASTRFNLKRLFELIYIFSLYLFAFILAMNDLRKKGHVEWRDALSTKRIKYYYTTNV